MRILCLSNGHGEDAIAVRILTQLQQRAPQCSLAALPLVGEGHAYQQLEVPFIGPVQPLPSGGFNRKGRQLWRDMRGGLLRLLATQFMALKRWRRAGQNPDSPMVLAVGDLVPLLMAWWSGMPYAFVGTAKSEYYLRDESHWLPSTSRIRRWLGAIYYPWERWLMARSRCKAVYPRDRLTADTLQQYGIAAMNLGNPMMDGLGLESSNLMTPRINEALESSRPLVILLLPGSRSPEAERNWLLILQAVADILVTFPQREVHCLGAIAPGLDLSFFQDVATEQGWHLSPQSPESVSRTSIPSESADAPESESMQDLHNPALPATMIAAQIPTLSLTQNKHQLQLSQFAFASFLVQADLAIAMAGTATEQFVGLGKPAIILPGKGPQFTRQFAQCQTRLLGRSVKLVDQPGQVGETLKDLLQDPDFWHLAAQNGKHRLGPPGAAARIADHLLAIAADES